MTQQPYEAGYFQIIADPNGAALTLCATGTGGLVCLAGPQTGRLSKWLLTQAGGGYWFVRSAAPLTTPPPASRRVSNLDGSPAGVTVDTFNKESPNQMWSFAVDGQILRVRCYRDTSLRLAGVAGAAPVLGPDQVPEVALAEWHLVEVSAAD